MLLILSKILKDSQRFSKILDDSRWFSMILDDSLGLMPAVNDDWCERRFSRDWHRFVPRMCGFSHGFSRILAVCVGVDGLCAYLFSFWNSVSISSPIRCSILLLLLLNSCLVDVNWRRCAQWRELLQFHCHLYGQMNPLLARIGLGPLRSDQSSLVKDSSRILVIFFFPPPGDGRYANESLKSPKVPRGRFPPGFSMDSR